MMTRYSIVILLCISISAPAQKVAPAFDWLSRFSNTRDFTINKTEVYFTIQSPNEDISSIACIKKINGQWSKPELVHFTGYYRDIEPFLSNDGLRLYFSSNRPTTETDTFTKDYDIWYVERKNITDNWSKAINIGTPVNTLYNEFYPSVTANRSIYYTSDAPNSTGKDDIFLSTWTGEKYNNPLPLDSNINSAGYEFNAYVAPDERFIIYTMYGRKDGLGSGDLYISIRQQNGEWGKARNLGPIINSKQMDYCPFVDIGNNMLYFTSKRSNIKTENYTSLKDFEKAINQYENGQSRIYKISLQDILKDIK
ncbi:MAG: hypothetical protein V4561_04610 [Bacteroidota bacterium]